MAATQNGIPGIRGTDHIGFNVPDLDAAEEFLVSVLGCECVYTLGGKRADDDWMHTHLGVHPRTEIEEIRFFRLRHGANFEVFLYRAAAGQTEYPLNSDPGGFHIALYVDDLDAAIAYLHAHGIATMGEPTGSAQAAHGQRWVYFRSPWGLQFELVSYPAGKAYERESTQRLWHPAHPEL
ncbi:MAG: VOC family protein [Microbacterium sp.]